MPNAELKLAGLETELAILKTNMEGMDGKLDRLLHHIEGNGKPGLILKVDRLEQAESRRTYFFGVIFTALVGLGVEVLMRMFK